MSGERWFPILGWSWMRGPLMLTLSPGDIQRPSVDFGWIDEERIWIAAAFGTPGSDPVASIALDHIKAPRWLHALSDYRYARRRTPDLPPTDMGA